MPSLPSLEQMAAYRSTARKRQESRQHILNKRRETALSFAKQAALFLKTACGAEQVILFGSLSRQGVFDEHSDVDLAVLGLDERAYYRILAELMNMQPEIDVDLVRMEGAAPSLLRSIQEGITL